MEGLVGSVVTTYGTQTRERCQARTEVRGALNRADNAVSVEDDEELDAALEDLATKAMLAALPRFLVDLYSWSKRAYIFYLRRAHEKTNTESERGALLATAMDFRRVANEMAKLFMDATWHPGSGSIS